MNRRNVVKNIGLLGVSVPLLYSCFKETKQEKVIQYRFFNLNETKAKICKYLAQAIIPDEDDSPGAKALNLDKVALKLMDATLSEDIMEDLNLGIEQITRYYNEHFKTVDLKIESDQFKAFLEQLSDYNLDVPKIKDAEGRVALEINQTGYFFEVFKNYIIMAFQTSQYIQQDIYGYKIIPGKFIGKVKITNETDLKTLLS